MKSILLVATNKFPIPPVQGGSIQQITWKGLVEPNEEAKDPVRFTVLSAHDKEAEQIASNYKKTEVCFVSYPPS